MYISKILHNSTVVNKVIHSGMMRKADSDFITAVVIRTRGQDLYNTNISILFTIRNNQ